MSWNPWVRFPNFLLIGAMKAGTTSLYHYLGIIPRSTCLRSRLRSSSHGESHWRRGDRLVPEPVHRRPEAVAIGEASNVYTEYPRYQGVPQRIAETSPMSDSSTSSATPSSESAPTTRPGWPRVPSGHPSRWPSSRTHLRRLQPYSLQIEQYMRCFSTGATARPHSEDLRSARAATVRRAYEFLGVDVGYVPGRARARLLLDPGPGRPLSGPGVAPKGTEDALPGDQAIQGAREQLSVRM